MFNGIQFLALAIASVVIYRYALHDKLKVGTMEKWPENVNPILSIFRENFDKGDKWGSTISFLFALCDVAMDYNVPIPVALQYVPSPFGSATDDYSYIAICELLEAGKYIYEPLTTAELEKHVAHALKVLGRYDSLLRIEGENY